jgi:hypothetical protein
MFTLGEKTTIPPRFEGDTLTHDCWSVLMDGVPVAGISNLSYKPKFNVSVSHLRMAGPMPPCMAKDAYHFHDSGPLTTLDAAFEWAVAQCNRMLEWRAKAGTK